jgi:hypothetical protein
MLDSLCPKFLETALHDPAKEFGHTLGNIFYSVFYPINYWPEKLRIKHQVNLEKYKDAITKELDKIPTEKLTEPPISIVGPAFEASKYHIDCNEIRTMFAKLIAASMNSDTQQLVHHSFVEIVKQLSPLDSSHINFLKNGNYYPIVQYRGNVGPHFRILKSNVFLSNPLHQDTALNSVSFANLERLGLVTIAYDTLNVPNTNYDIFKADPLFIKYESVIEQLRNKATLITNNTDLDINWFENVTSISIHDGVVGLTPLGKSLASICC